MHPSQKTSLLFAHRGFEKGLFFCAAHGLSEHIFYYCQPRHSEQRQDSGGFVEMEFIEIEMTAGQGWVPGF